VIIGARHNARPFEKQAPCVCKLKEGTGQSSEIHKGRDGAGKDVKVIYGKGGRKSCDERKKHQTGKKKKRKERSVTARGPSVGGGKERGEAVVDRKAGKEKSKEKGIEAKRDHMMSKE